MPPITCDLCYMCSFEFNVQHRVSLTNNNYMTLCSAVISAVDCLVGITQCTREHTRDAITTYLSLLYSYKYIANRPLTPEANYHNIRQAFQCTESKFKRVCEGMVAWYSKRCGTVLPD